MENKMLVLTDESFAEKLSQSPIFVVDFWADWCVPCKRVAPLLEELSNEFGDRAVFGKLNVDEHNETAARFGVMSIPCVLVFKNGELVNQKVGAVPIGAYRNMIESLL